MADTTNLPASSLGELEKIIKAYGHIGKEADLDSLSKLTGIGRTTISPNNPFLVDTGIVNNGKKKKITDLGARLARALDHGHATDTTNCWKEIVTASEFLSNLVSTIRIKGTFGVEDAASHALYASGQKNNKANRTGARAAIDILVGSGLVKEENDVLTVATNSATEESDGVSNEQTSPAPPQNPIQTDPQPVQQQPVAPVVAAPPAGALPISINIELHLPATDDPKVYQELFKALRENLIDQPSGK